MGRPGKLTVAAALLLSATAMPATSLASSGGASVPGSTSPTTTTAPPSGSMVTASGNGIELSARSATLEYSGLWITGTVPASQVGKTVVIQLENGGSGAGWTPAAQATVTAGGSFTAFWRSSELGQVQFRATEAGGGATSPAISVTVYRPSTATLYGPGLYGHHTACGRVLRRTTVGVANRTLPCGTSVSIYYRGRTAVVPVIDRGPYANHANWDLTEATAQTLGMSGTSTIGTIPLASSQQ
jgi:peptidoglycan lytic transglycosylase